MGEITREQWRKYHYGHLQTNKPKKKPSSYILTDGYGYVYAQGAYALCVYVKKNRQLTNAKIQPA